MHGIAATYRNLAGRHNIAEPRLRVVAGWQGEPDALLRRDQLGRGKKLDVLGGIELLELLHGAAEPDHPVLDSRHELGRHESRTLRVVPGLNGKMRERLGRWIDDHTDQAPATPVGGVNVTTDRERFPFAA
jgi:hypothetical protein